MDTHLAKEAGASFKEQFIKMAAMQATPEQKAELFLAATGLDRHFLGKQACEKGTANPQEASEIIKQAMLGAITEAVRQSNLPNRQQILGQMQQLNLSSYKSMLQDAFSLFNLEDSKVPSRQGTPVIR